MCTDPPDFPPQMDLIAPSPSKLARAQLYSSGYSRMTGCGSITDRSPLHVLFALMFMLHYAGAARTALATRVGQLLLRAASPAGAARGGDLGMNPLRRKATPARSRSTFLRSTGRR